MMLPDRGYTTGTESAVGKGLRQADSVRVCALCSGVCVKAASAPKTPLIVSYSLTQGQLLGEQSDVPPHWTFTLILRRITEMLTLWK